MARPGGGQPGLYAGAGDQVSSRGTRSKPVAALEPATWTVPKRLASAIAFCDQVPVST